MAAETKGLYFIRFVCGALAEPEDVKFAWSVIDELAEKLLHNQTSHEESK